LQKQYRSEGLLLLSLILAQSLRLDFSCLIRLAIFFLT
jgi:hypothetical protein